MRTISSLIVLLVLSGVWPAAAQTPKTQEAAEQALSSAQLDKMLKDMGLQQRPLSTNVWQTTIDRDGWKVHVLLALAHDGARIELECKFSAIADPEIVPASAWLKLLEENERITPAHFSYDKLDRRIHLYKAFDNSAVTPARLKQELDNFDATVRRTQNVWRSENFAAAEAISIPPRTVDQEPKKTSGLDGAWRLVRLETRGQSTTEQHLAAGLGVTFTGDKVALNIGVEPERTAVVRFDPNQKLKAIDFISANDHVEKGIYLGRNGVANDLRRRARGEDRPRQFVTDPKEPGVASGAEARRNERPGACVGLESSGRTSWLLVLKRARNERRRP